MPAELVFHLAACLYPGGLLDRSAVPSMLPGDVAANAPGPADRSLQRLAARRDALGGKTRVILAGDQIYVDATAGLFDPSLGNAPLTRAYDRLDVQYWRNRALSQSDSVFLMDDHEIEDNWEPSLNSRRNAALFDLMRQSRWQFLDRQRHQRPLPMHTPGASRRLWSEKARLGGRLLFVGDTRSERTARDPATILDAKIMSDAQHDALVVALGAQQVLAPAAHKFVATPSIFLPRRLSSTDSRTGDDDPAAGLRSDAWDGYPGSQRRVLAALCDAGIQRCVFLSGDEHIGCVSRATVWRLNADSSPGRSVTLWSVHAPALYAPYPFANSVPADFPEQEVFEFSVPGAQSARYRCCVDAWFPPPRNGFAEIHSPANPATAAGFEVCYRDGLDATRDAWWPPR